MGDFAVVAEGYTDQVVLQNILLGFFSDAEDEPVINFEQPRLDATASSGAHPPAGWSLVIKYFEDGLYRQALQTNGYLVVHIDTDVSEEYGVAKFPPGDETRLIDAVIARFRGLIGEEIWQIHGDRFIFAVAVHAIECWLLPAIFESDRSKRAKLVGCFEAADRELQRQGLPRLEGQTKGSRKNPEGYKAASKVFRKRKLLIRHAEDNLSFKAFVDELERRAIALPAEPR